jgi:hypothetical protein
LFTYIGKSFGESRNLGIRSNNGSAHSHRCF